jgi:hypothetical protein
MKAALEQMGSDTTAIRPFRVDVPEADLTDLRRRIKAVSVFPDELYLPPRNWAENAYPKLVHFNKVAKGGHFAAWEQPQLFSEEVRAGFRSLRQFKTVQESGGGCRMTIDTKVSSILSSDRSGVTHLVSCARGDSHEHHDRARRDTARQRTSN